MSQIHATPFGPPQNTYWNSICHLRPLPFPYVGSVPQERQLQPSLEGCPSGLRAAPRPLQGQHWLQRAWSQTCPASPTQLYPLQCLGSTVQDGDLGNSMLWLSPGTSCTSSINKNQVKIPLPLSQVSLACKHHLLACRMNYTIQYNSCWQKWGNEILSQNLHLLIFVGDRELHHTHNATTTYKQLTFEKTTMLRLSITKTFIQSLGPLKSHGSKAKWTYPT